LKVRTPENGVFFNGYLKNMATWLNYTPARGYSTPQPTPTPYLSPSQGGNKYVPQGTVSAPVSQQATPIASMANGGTLWNNNTYGYEQTPYRVPSAQVYQQSKVPNPTPVPTPPNPNPPPSGGDPNRGVIDSANDSIDRDFETAMSDLSGQESSLNQQVGQMVNEATTDYGGVQTALGAEQATNVAGLQSEATTAKTQEKGALTQARDLFRETQQSNIAQMSGLGISSSSVAEALAERLGVETARRIAGVTGSTNEIMQNIAKETTRVETYYKEKLTTLEKQLADRKGAIQSSLMEGLRQINNARNQATADKANRRAELWRNAQTAAQNAKAEAQKFKQQMDMWREQKAAALTPIQTDPNYLNNLMTQYQNITQNPNFSQFDVGMTADQNAKGQYSTKLTIGQKKKPTEDDPLATPQF
jgi:hypothetical protein